jgi:Uma2 family endonuclease
MSAATKLDMFLTIPDYLAMEQQSLEKHEYHDGEIYAMAGGTPRHALIANNAGAIIRQALKGKPCSAYSSDLQVALTPSRFVYPDLTVVCDPPLFFEENANAVNNPTLIVEVLSPGTADYDRGGKFARYRQIDSFKEYILISQDEPNVETWYKLDSNVWRINTFTTFDQSFELTSLGVIISMKDLYDKVDFE